MLGIRVLIQTNDLNPFLFPYEGVLAFPGDVTYLAFWILIGIMASFYAAPY